MKIYLFILLFLLIGCETIELNKSSLNTIYLETDQDLYHSGEIIHISTDIFSQVDLTNVSVRFYGIYAGGYRLDQTEIVDLEKGENNISLDYNAPSCYGCSGIRPGTYQIAVDVIHNGAILANKSINVEIRQ